MQLLMLTGQAPYPPHAGGALRTFGLLTGLHQAGHVIDLLTFYDPALPPPQTTPLGQLCRLIAAIPPPQRSTATRLGQLLWSNRADLETRFYSAVYDLALETRLKAGRYDVIQIESLEMATYLSTIKKHANGAAIIYDSFNAEFDLQRVIYETDLQQVRTGNWRRVAGMVYSWIQTRRLTRFERRVCQTAAATIAVSEADAEAFRKLYPTVNVTVVPNGIFAADYQPPSDQADSKTALQLNPDAVVFTGSMAYRPNVDAVTWFAEAIWPIVRAEIPTARFYIVGSNPHPAVLSLGTADSRIIVTGSVPAIEPYLHQAAVYVAPLRMGSGTRLKLLQAMAAGRAVVSTAIGAQGLRAENGIELLLADDPQNFARAIVNLLRNVAQRTALGSAAQALVQREYDWSALLPQLMRVYDSLQINRTK